MVEFSRDWVRMEWLLESQQYLSILKENDNHENYMNNKKYMQNGVIIHIFSAILPALRIMDSLPQFLLTLLSSLLCLSICIYYLYQSRKLHKKTCNSVPEVGGAWPIIGHMHLFGGRKLTFKTLGAMAEKYGPFFTIRIGSHKTLVVNNWEAARECLTVHAKNFSGKPASQASRLLGYNYAMFGFAPYGPHWREMRKIASVELLSNQRLEMLKHVRSSEVKTSIKELYKAYTSSGSKESGVLIEMKQWFKDLTHVINLRMVVGRRFFGGGGSDAKGRKLHCQKLVRDFFYLFGVSMLSDAIPFLGWLDFGGYEKAMKRTAKELDAMVEEWLDEHKQRRLLGGEGKRDQDFMDVMLRTVDDAASISEYDADTIHKATCLNLIVAGESNMVPLIWALSLLLNHPHVLKKAQNELDLFVGKDRFVEESDIENLVYLQAIVKETFRLYPPGPIIPRAAIEDCTLSNGYHVSAGTRILLNVWNIQHDELVWSNPNEFQPERFLTGHHKDTDLRGQNFELIPFGSGRRSCAGLSLALQVVHLTLASLLHSFEVATPSNVAVDMTESPGLTNEKATPLEVLLTPRLVSHLYTQYI